MAEECMNIFERDKLPLVANVEQVRSVTSNLPLLISLLELCYGVDS